MEGTLYILDTATGPPEERPVAVEAPSASGRKAVMTIRHRLAAACAATLVAAVAAGTTAAATKPVLRGVVGPGYTISLKTSTGKKVTKLKPGTYVFKISDKASIHDFHLTGPGVNKTTTVGGTGNFTWTLKLKKGRYHYQCDPHATVLNGNFTVG